MLPPVFLAALAPPAEDDEEAVVLTPALAATPQGHGTGASIVTSAAGLALLQDTISSATPPSLVSGFTNILTEINDEGDNDISMRLSWKVVSSGETIPSAGGNRRIVRIYANVDPADPIATSASAGGTSAGADNIAVPALVLPGDRFVVGFLRRSGTVVTTFAAPLDSDIKSQESSAAASSADSGVLLASYAGQNLAIGSSVDWVVGVVALNGATA